MQEGEEKGRRAVALKLLHAGVLEIEKIAEMTGLLPEEVRALGAE